MTADKDANPGARLEQASKLNSKILLPVVLSLVLLFALFAGLSLLKINGAVVAAGELRVITAKTLIQHNAGGLVAQLFVKNGDYIEKDQPLVTLDQTRTRAVLDELILQKTNHEKQILALKTWLNTDVISGPVTVLSPIISKELLEDPFVLQIQAKSTRLRTETLADQKSIEEAGQQIVLLSQELELTRALLENTRSEYERYEQLAAQGYFEQAQLRDIEKNLKRIEIDYNRIKRSIKETEGNISQLSGRIDTRLAAWQEELSDQLIQAQQSLDIINTRLIEAETNHSNTVIRAPFPGRIANLVEINSGSVIRAGDAIGELIPLERDVYVRLSVALAEVELLQVGQAAEIQIGTAKQMNEPTFQGKITAIGAESTQQQNKDPIVRVRVDFEPDQNIPENLLRNAIPATGYIKTRERSIADYLYDPIRRSTERALREY